MHGYIKSIIMHRIKSLIEYRRMLVRHDSVTVAVYSNSHARQSISLALK